MSDDEYIYCATSMFDVVYCRSWEEALQQAMLMVDQKKRWLRLKENWDTPEYSVTVRGGKKYELVTISRVLNKKTKKKVKK